MGALEEIADRLLAFEKQVIPTSEAYASAWVQTQNALYWTNLISITSASTLGVGAIKFNCTAQLRLHRCKFTQLQTDDSLARQCLADLGAIMRAFGRKGGRDLLSIAYPTPHANWFPTSEIPITGALAVIPAPDGTDHFGAVITITFAYLEAGVT